MLGHGGKETPEFQRQTEQFAAALRTAGKQVALVVAPGYNHFEFAETFANPYGPLGRASLELMGLQAGNTLAWAPSGTKGAVEYYASAIDQYFITADPAEIAKLDTGVLAGWTRTSLGFNVYPDASGGAAAVCRFVSARFGAKPDHFYTLDATECAALKTNSGWIYEGVAFYARPADQAGNCPTGTTSVYRLYNAGLEARPAIGTRRMRTYVHR